MKQGIAILGIFVADLAFRAGRQPVMGETLMGSGFAMGPGGKGSNQAVAAARAGGKVSFISRLGKDAFGDIAVKVAEGDGLPPSRKPEFDACAKAATEHGVPVKDVVQAAMLAVMLGKAKKTGKSGGFRVGPTKKR